MIPAAKPRWWGALLIITMGVSSIALTHSSAAGNSQTALGGTACNGTIDSALFPELIPAHVGWNELWNQATASITLQTTETLRQRFDIDGNVLSQVLETAAQVRISRERVARGEPVSNLGVVVPVARPDVATDAAAAELGLAARDELVRRLTPSDFAHLDKKVAMQRPETFRFEGIGRVRGQTPPKCFVSINGAEYPHLIPESYYWLTYFQFRTRSFRASANEARLAEFLESQRKYHLNIPLDDVKLVFAAASAVADKVDQLQREGGGGHTLAHRQHVAGLVAETRAELIRNLSPASWLQVQTDANRVRSGTIFDFPPFEIRQ